MPDEKTLGDAPIEDAYREQMNELAYLVDRFFNGSLKGKDREVGFVLMVFDFKEHKNVNSRCNYISNAERSDVVKLLKEQIKRFESQKH